MMVSTPVSALRGPGTDIARPCQRSSDVDVNALRGLLRFVVNLEDPRGRQVRRDQALDMIAVAISALACGEGG